jgi:hypothetical protein
MPKITRHGGPTDANGPVIVGTGGPELQVLAAAGDIVPLKITQAAQALAEVLHVAPATPVVDAPPVISPYEGMSRSQLQAECEQRGLAKSGNKDELVARLIEFDAA